MQSITDEQINTTVANATKGNTHMFKKLTLKSYAEIMAPFTKIVAQLEKSINTRGEMIVEISNKIDALNESRAAEYVEIKLARTGLSNIQKVLSVGGLKDVE